MARPDTRCSSSSTSLDTFLSLWIRCISQYYGGPLPDIVYSLLFDLAESCRGEICSIVYAFSQFQVFLYTAAIHIPGCWLYLEPRDRGSAAPRDCIKLCADATHVRALRGGCHTTSGFSLTPMGVSWAAHETPMVTFSPMGVSRAVKCPWASNGPPMVNCSWAVPWAALVERP